MTRRAALLRLDGRLLFGRNLFRFALFFAVVVGAVAAGFGAGTAYARFARGLTALAPLVAAFGALLGAVSLSGDGQTGALRALLLRPVGRVDVVLSRALWLVVAQAAVIAAGALAAALAARTAGPFEAVVHGEDAARYELLAAEEIASLATRLVLLATPGLLVAPLVGLALGAFVDDPAPAALAALGATLGPELAAAFAGVAPAAWWGASTRVALDVLGELADGVQTRQAVVSAAAFAKAAWIAPAAWAAAAVAAAAARLRARDVLA